MKKIGIIKYGAGNLFSLCATLDRLQLPFGFISEEAQIEEFSHLLIPGVGHAARAFEKLTQTGLVEALKNTSKPTLGICVGMQLLTSYSDEGEVDLTGIFPQKTIKFPTLKTIKIPHMGWNKVHFEPVGIFKNIPPDSYFYFVHSYFIEYNPKFDIGFCQYGLQFSAAIQRDNYVGVQFHPEKSGRAGEQLLLNFYNTD
ncbi:MAG: imidazole glycerol phosphate synthase subunit HisH [Pedobacter sp.]|nr:MAG: imidazole glycerol phosphate synthase subunit HisH [Pedobacter sp.]